MIHVRREVSRTSIIFKDGTKDDLSDLLYRFTGALEIGATWRDFEHKVHLLATAAMAGHAEELVLMLQQTPLLADVRVQGRSVGFTPTNGVRLQICREERGGVEFTFFFDDLRRGCRVRNRLHKAVGGTVIAGASEEKPVLYFEDDQRSRWVFTPESRSCLGQRLLVLSGQKLGMSLAHRLAPMPGETLTVDEGRRPEHGADAFAEIGPFILSSRSEKKVEPRAECARIVVLADRIRPSTSLLNEGNNDTLG